MRLFKCSLIQVYHSSASYWTYMFSSYLPIGDSLPSGTRFLNSRKRVSHGLWPRGQGLQYCRHFGDSFSFLMRFSSFRPNSSVIFFKSSRSSSCGVQSPTSPPVFMFEKIQLLFVL